MPVPLVAVAQEDVAENAIDAEANHPPIAPQDNFSGSGDQKSSYSEEAQQLTVNITGDTDLSEIQMCQHLKCTQGRMKLSGQESRQLSSGPMLMWFRSSQINPQGSLELP